MVLNSAQMQSYVTLYDVVLKIIIKYILNELLLNSKFNMGSIFFLLLAH
jgi:hypothetical protein